jgi:hypothetical protein
MDSEYTIETRKEHRYEDFDEISIILCGIGAELTNWG